MNKHLLVFAAACSLVAASPAAATVTILAGSSAVQPDENLLFNNSPTPGLTLEGITNQTDTLITATGGETLVAAGGGQARLDTADHTLNTTFTFNGLANQLVGFDLADNGLAFTSTEFRLFGGTATQATLTFVDTSGQVFTQTFAIPKSGFFNAVATNGELIDYFSIAANGSLGDVRQVRLGGVQLIPTVPEPATWAMMIAGFGGVGSVVRNRRRRVATAV
jgi:hypothetical protein